jgi:ribonucleoside-diphosphate reductase beta chain
VVELFAERLPETAAELEAGRTGLAEGVSLYHMLLEGVVFLAGQHALLEDLADGALPGVREGLERVQLDERWHVGFGLRCLIECQPSRELLDEILARSEDAAGAWGDVLPASTREFMADLAHHRLAAVGLVEPHAAAEQAVRRAPAA